MQNFRDVLVSNAKNMIWGNKVPEKILVIESDDWGSNRMPSKEMLSDLIRKGILSENCSPNDRFDTIIRSSDIESLYEVLTSVKDKYGNHAVISPFFNATNPDFDAIRRDGFEQYHYETFDTTLSRYGEKDTTLDLLHSGIHDGIICPAYHGREHLCVPLWMRYLQKNESTVRNAFDYHYYSVPNINGVPKEARAFRPSLYFDTATDKDYIKSALADGVALLEKVLGVKPTCFCPPNGLSHIEFDEELSKYGIIGIKASEKRIEPDGNGGYSIRKIKWPSQNQWGQKYYYRNCWFEQYQQRIDAVDFCMTQISGAFRWKRPAIICSHHVNYVGGINIKNRDRGLKLLQVLLSRVVKEWPDVVFMGSSDYVNTL